MSDVRNVDLDQRARELARALDTCAKEVLEPLLRQHVTPLLITQAADDVTGLLHQRESWTRGHFRATVAPSEGDPGRLVVSLRPLTTWATSIWLLAMDLQRAKAGPVADEREDKLEEIERIWSAASAGPWRFSEAHGGRFPDSGQYGSLDTLRLSEALPLPVIQAGDGWLVTTKEDAAAIACAPEHIAWLLAEVRRLRGS